MSQAQSTQASTAIANKQTAVQRSERIRVTIQEKAMYDTLANVTNNLKDLTGREIALEARRSTEKRYQRALYDLIAVRKEEGTYRRLTIGRGMTTAEVELAARTYVNGLRTALTGEITVKRSKHGNHARAN